MRILVITPDPATHGPIPKHAPYLIRGLRGLGADVRVAYWGRHSDGEPLATKLAERPRDLVRLAREATQARPDVIVLKTSHEWRTLIRDLPLLLCLRRCARTLVVQYHGSQPEALGPRGPAAFKLATRAVIRLADGILLLCTDELDRFSRFSTDASYHIVSNPFVPGITTGDEDDVLRRIKAKRASGDFVILFVGRVIRSKGIFDLLVAVAALQNALGIHLVVAGEGKRMADLAREVHDLGLPEAVTLCGHRTGFELTELYRAADAFCLPTYWGEGFPTVIAEAMGAGLPVITTQIKGAADYLVAEQNALFVAAKDPIAIASAIVRLQTDPALCRRMGDANARAVARFAPEAVARQYLDALQAVAAHRQKD